MKQDINVSPENMAIVANAGIRFLNLESTLIPGNLKQQLAVLEVVLGGLARGELVLASTTPDPVESGLDKTEDPDKKELAPAPTASEVAAKENAAALGPEPRSKQFFEGANLSGRKETDNSGSTPSGDSKA